jgi:hypothetical protein
LSVGFEYCLGYDYRKLNNTIAEPLHKLKTNVNSSFLELSITTCKLDFANETDSISSESELKEIKEKRKNCKNYFDFAIKSMFNDFETIDDYLGVEGNDKLLE